MMSSGSQSSSGDVLDDVVLLPLSPEGDKDFPEDDREKSCQAGWTSASLKTLSILSFSPSQEWKLDPVDSRDELDLFARGFSARVGKGPKLKGDEEAYPFCLEDRLGDLEAASIDPNVGELGERGAFCVGVRDL